MQRPAKIFFLTAVFLAGLGAPISVWAPSWPDQNIKIEAFSFDSNVILQMYNFAQTNATVDGNGNKVFKLDNFPTNMAPAMMSIIISNNNATAQSPYLQILIYDPSYNGGNPVAWGCSVSTRQPIPAKTRVTLNALDFQPVSFSGNFIQSYVDNQLDPIGDDPSKIKPLLTHQFKVCAEIVPSQTDCSSVPYQNALESTACTTFSIMTGNPAANCISAAPLQPFNCQVSSELPRFSWSPAVSASGGASYVVEVMERDLDSAPKQRVAVPLGQNYYQWTSGDYALRAGVKYFWRVISLDQFGKPFCGAGGQGSSATYWFSFSGKRCGPFSAVDADRIAQDKALGPGAAATEVGKKLGGLRPVGCHLDDGGDTDGLLCRLRDGKAKVVSHELVTQ